MSMMILRVILVAFTLVMQAYTTWVIYRAGMGQLFPAIYHELCGLGWSGQFSSDLLCFIILSMFWTAWREKFSTKGIILGLVAFNGMYFFAPYLLYLTFKTKGDMRLLLLGEDR